MKHLRLLLAKPVREESLRGLLIVTLIGLIADSITFLYLPAGSETNPVVNFLGSGSALFFKAALIGYVLFLWNYLPFSQTHLMVYAVAIAAGFLGFGSNLAVLLH